MKKLYYLASPYSHEDQNVMKTRFDLVTKASAELMSLGIFVYSPITHSHPMSEYGLPTTWDFWKEYDELFLSKCDALLVLKLDGWERSTGVTAEIDYAKLHEIEITYLDTDLSYFR
jgi:hypothetical protein